MRQPHLDFNDALLESIDETISELLSRDVADALYTHLKVFHSVSRDELPYRLDTLFASLEKVFGVRGSETITKAIARRFYQKFGLDFNDHSSFTLIEYVDEARMKLRTPQSE